MPRATLVSSSCGKMKIASIALNSPQTIREGI
jgi:hypothetical protein